jgi:DNA repair exonuclease SbcCD ATPase subunit
LPSKKGVNRFTWDFRRAPLPSIHKVFIFGGLAGSRVAPGKYTLRMTLGDVISETEATILPNPKVLSSAKDFVAQQKMLVSIENTVKEMHESVNQMRSAKTQLSHYAKLLKDSKNADSLLEKGKELTKRINSWEENLIQAKQKTFQDVINFNNKLNAQLIQLKSYIDQANPKVTNGAKERFDDLMNDWQVYKNERDTIINTEMQAYNSLFKTLAIPALILDEK